jgi:hypothetical protein
MPACALPDLMADFVMISEASLQQIRKTAETPPRVSVIDVIRAITGLSASNCHNVLQRVIESFPEVSRICSKFKFPGRGQRETPVADARGIAEIIMVLPGRAAKVFRHQTASVIVRYLGGYLTLVEEVAAIRLAQQQMPEEHLARVFGQTVESETAKRVREENEVAEMELRSKKARVQHLTEMLAVGFKFQTEFGILIDDRDRMRAKDMINSAMFSAVEGAPDDKEICIRGFLLEQGVRTFGMDIKLGMLAKKLYLDANPGYVFAKKMIYANGQMCSANIWRESQRPFLQRALTMLQAGSSAASPGE